MTVIFRLEAHNPVILVFSGTVDIEPGLDGFFTPSWFNTQDEFAFQERPPKVVQEDGIDSATVV
ncbi:MAG: hypothetical protein ACRD2L_24410, partial [Terriglobia bacterium]